jgi:hypothetical protein
MANSTVAALNRKIHHFAVEINGATRSGTNKSALAVVTSVAGFLGGRSIVLRGVGSSGAKVGVRYDIKGTRNPTALVYMFGPAHLIERDTSAHTIIGKSVGRVKKGSTKGLTKGARAGVRRAAKQGLYDALFGGTGGGRMGGDGVLGTRSGWATGPFDHPGTSGKHPFEKGVNAARPFVTRIYQRGVNGAMRRSFTG